MFQSQTKADDQNVHTGILTHSLRRRLVQAAAGTAVLAALLTPTFAHASATNLFERAAPITATLPLERIGLQTQDVTLDWRTPETKLTFELPPSDVVEDMELRLLGDPLSSRIRATRIEMTFNDADPVPLELDARGFTATLPLDTRALRSGRNTVALRLAPPASESCLTQADGGWNLDLSRSRVTAVARPRSRSVYLGEVETLLARASETPRRLSIRAYGDNARAHEALVAQGLALRTTEVPRFTLGRQDGEMSVIVGTRASLAGVVTDDSIIDGKGPRIAVHPGRPLRLVVTGDTSKEVRDSLDAFATHALPNARRRITSPEEMRLLNPLTRNVKISEGRERIHNLGGLGFSENWGAGPDAVSFEVADPQAASARVKLDLRREDFVASDSRVSISLNGRDLGTTVLDNRKVGVDIRVPQGWLRGSNTLTVTPELMPSIGGCTPTHARAGMSVGARSYVEITQDVASSDADLSRLSAGGGVFADDNGRGTHVTLPATRSEREAALRVLGKIARAHGGGLIEATYGTDHKPGADLIALGSLPDSIDAPRVFSDIRREGVRGAGVAAFPDGERWVAQFAPLRAGSMTSAADALVGPAWHDLSGGIARIRDGEAEMVKTAYSLAPADETRTFAFPESLFQLVILSDITTNVRQSYDASAATLSQSWSEVDIVAPELMAALKSPFSKVHLRGRFGPPRAEDIRRERVAAGFRFRLKRWERKAERRAQELRNATGLPEAKPISWKWGDRHFSLSAVLVMFAFGFSCWFLSTSEPISRGGRG